MGGVDISFLTPLGALVALAAVVPAAVILAASRRARAVRALLALPPRRSQLVPLAALAAVAAAVALAAAQPIADRTTARAVRADAEAFVVVDVSRSMLARHARGRTRLARAKEIAADLRASLPDVRTGVASLTDRVLPHQFPSANDAVFEATVEDALDVERPPPRGSVARTATSLDALETFASRTFFSPRARRRVLFVLTDGESTPISAGVVGRALRRPPAIVPVFIHLWSRDERVYTRGVPEPGYRPDPTARTVVASLASAAGGRVVPERDVADAVAAARKALASGPTVVDGSRRARTALAPFVLAFGLVPLGVLLRRRDR